MPEYNRNTAVKNAVNRAAATSYNRQAKPDVDYVRINYGNNTNSDDKSKIGAKSDMKQNTVIEVKSDVKPVEKSNEKVDTSSLDYFKINEFLKEYSKHYKEFLEFEYKKADLITKHEIEELSSILSVEQALIMKTTSYEAKRLKLLNSCPDITFEQLVNNAPDRYKNNLEKFHKQMWEAIYKIKDLNDSASVVVKTRLKSIQEKTAALDIYDGNGVLNRKTKGNGFISKSV